MDYQKGTYILVSDQQLSDLLVPWVTKELRAPSATMRIIRKHPDYPDSIFLEICSDIPLDLKAFQGIFKKYDPEEVYDPANELSLDGMYTMLPEPITLGIFQDLIHQLSGIPVKEIIPYHSFELDGVIGLST